ncbi:hypothetical protein Dimus_031816, partial [Dionaea muscipula]
MGEGGRGSGAARVTSAARNCSIARQLCSSAARCLKGWALDSLSKLLVGRMVG